MAPWEARWGHLGLTAMIHLHNPNLMWSLSSGWRQWSVSTGRHWVSAVCTGPLCWRVVEPALTCGSLERIMSHGWDIWQLHALAGTHISVFAEGPEVREALQCPRPQIPRRAEHKMLWWGPVSGSSIPLPQAEEWKPLSRGARAAGEGRGGVENRTLTLQQLTCQVQDFLWWHGGGGPSTWFLSFHSTLLTHFLTIKRREDKEMKVISSKNKIKK